MFARSIALAFASTLLFSTVLAQTDPVSPTPDAIRVTVSMNADGSRTVYEFDSLHHRANATTTQRDGKLVGKIRYVLDEAGRFASGEVYGPDDQLRFKTLYKYDQAGKLAQETQLGPNDALRNKIVYSYDKLGRQIGYTVYDPAGKVIRRTPGLTTPTPPPRTRR
jgi:hypothetical protein